jgi:CheY-like chemotaxis protein
VPYRIVVADASPSVQKAAQMVFPETDYRLHFYDSGNGLVDGLAAVQPDTILLSVSLPDSDPYEIARTIVGREELRNVPLIFLKGTFELFDSERAEGLAYEAVVPKPFDSEKLAATVREAIERKVMPPSLPEEPVWEDMLPGKQSRPVPGPPVQAESPASEEAFRAKVQELVKREVLDMERELEKRIRARIIAELKEKA